jgi:DNA-binding HxlR family transcriptional regulator
VLDALSDTWVTLILTALADSPRRYSEHARSRPAHQKLSSERTYRVPWP